MDTSGSRLVVWTGQVDDYYWVPGNGVRASAPRTCCGPLILELGVEGRYGFTRYWAREVGFYGGIDYGDGYNGQGYLGGRWENAPFFTIARFNNIENVRISKV